MKKLVPILLLTCCLLVPLGCALQAKSGMATQMASDAVEADVVKANSTAGTLDAKDARAYVGEANDVLNGYYEHATVNLFAYWFDANKTILATTTVYNQLRSDAIDVRDQARRVSSTATTQPYTDAQAKQVALDEAKMVSAFNRIRLGTK
jgi:TRAP-type mannitol/chloroaromatic compound transport system substrate-binding protein